MKQTYSHILTLLFKHRYFSDNLFKSIYVSFADGTQKLMNDLGIVVKQFPGGFHLLSSNPELLDATEESNPIQLHLNCNDPYYINYTELPLYSVTDKFLYFNNLSDVSDSESEVFYLQKEEFVGQNEIVQLINAKVGVPGLNSEKEYHFTDATGKEITLENVKQSSQQPGVFMLSGLGQELLLFYEQGEEVKKFYNYPKAVWKKPFGIVEIFTGRLFRHYSVKGKIEYALNFNRRETIWKYFLVSSVYQKFNNLSIINKSKEQIFNPPQKINVDKNPEALVFESKSKIPLSEFSEDSFQLVDNYESGSGKGKIILKNLVKASTDQLFRDDEKSKETFYSHIYI